MFLPGHKPFENFNKAIFTKPARRYDDDSTMLIARIHT